MTTTRDEIERLVRELYCLPTPQRKDALMSAIERVLAERDRANQRYLANKAILNEELAERDARIAALTNEIESLREGNAVNVSISNSHFDKWQAAERRVEELTMEYCPDDMTPEMWANWEKHQKRASPEVEAEVRAALATEQPHE